MAASLFSRRAGADSDSDVDYSNLMAIAEMEEQSDNMNLQGAASFRQQHPQLHQMAERPFSASDSSSLSDACVMACAHLATAACTCMCVPLSVYENKNSGRKLRCEMPPPLEPFDYYEQQKSRPRMLQLQMRSGQAAADSDKVDVMKRLSELSNQEDSAGGGGNAKRPPQGSSAESALPPRRRAPPPRDRRPPAPASAHSARVVSPSDASSSEGEDDSAHRLPRRNMFDQSSSAPPDSAVEVLSDCSDGVVTQARNFDYPEVGDDDDLVHENKRREFFPSDDEEGGDDSDERLFIGDNAHHRRRVMTRNKSSRTRRGGSHRDATESKVRADPPEEQIDCMKVQMELVGIVRDIGMVLRAKRGAHAALCTALEKKILVFAREQASDEENETLLSKSETPSDYTPGEKSGVNSEEIDKMRESCDRLANVIEWLEKTTAEINQVVSYLRNDKISIEYLDLFVHNVNERFKDQILRDYANHRIERLPDIPRYI